MITVSFFFGAFAEFRKSLLASSCLSVRMEQLGSHWGGRDFMKFDIAVFFKNSPRKFEFH